MNFFDRAKRDTERITGNPNGAGVAITFKNPAGLTKVIYGMAAKTHLAVENQAGAVVNTKFIDMSFSEGNAIAAGYTIRDAEGVVDLKGHKVSYADSTGTIGHYTITESWPDESIGLITCRLQKLK